MPTPIPVPTERLTRDAFLAWAEQQPRGRFELVDGQVVAMAPERAAHAETKALAWLALRNAITAAGLPCQAFVDGLAVVIDDATSYEPDALVNCGPKVAPDSLVAPAPVVVVEVVSPSSRSIDSGEKLAGYFRVAGLRHYLILLTDRRLVVHHRRREDGGIETTLVSAGPIALDPPGLTIRVEDLFAAA